MGRKTYVLPEAKVSISQAVSYLADVPGNASAADGLVASLREALRNMESFPEMYPAVSEPRFAELGYRKAPVGNYLVLYRCEGARIYITHFFHQRQDYAKLM